MTAQTGALMVFHFLDAIGVSARRFFLVNGSFRLLFKLRFLSGWFLSGWFLE